MQTMINEKIYDIYVRIMDKFVIINCNFMLKN